jgi:hypothetical protein
MPHVLGGGEGEAAFLTFSTRNMYSVNVRATPPPLPPTSNRNRPHRLINTCRIGLPLAMGGGGGDFSTKQCPFFYFLEGGGGGIFHQAVSFLYFFYLWPLSFFKKIN